MAAILNGTSQYFSTTAVATAAPFTIAGYFNADDVTAAYYLFNIFKSTLDTSYWRLRAAGDVASDPLRMATGEIATAEAQNTSTFFTAGTWFKFSEVVTSNTSRVARLNNAGATTGVTDITPTGVNTTFFGASSIATVIGGFFKGKIAYYAVWNAVLAAADLAKYQAGFDPFHIQRANLVMVARFDASEATQIGAFTLAPQNTPTYETSPGLVTPRYWL